MGGLTLDELGQIGEQIEADDDAAAAATKAQRRRTQGRGGRR